MVLVKTPRSREKTRARWHKRCLECRWPGTEYVELGDAVNGRQMVFILCRPCKTIKPVRADHFCAGGNINSCGCVQRTAGNLNLENPERLARDRLWGHFEHCCKRDGEVNYIKRDKHDELLDTPCGYCGMISYRRRVFKIKGANRVVEFYANSVDRIDNDLGHTEDNVIACCVICQYYRGAKPQTLYISNAVHNARWLLEQPHEKQAEALMALVNNKCTIRECDASLWARSIIRKNTKPLVQNWN